DDHVGDELIVLVTPRPIQDITVGPGPIKLSRERVESWVKTWAAPARALDAPQAAGTLYTAREREAAQGSRMLTHEEPLPQTLYRVETKSAEPFMVRVALRLIVPGAASEPKEVCARHILV